MAAAAGLPAITASTVADLVDLVSWALLGGVGLSPLEAQTVLGLLWTEAGDR
jgi:hypothetical protein